MKKIALVNQKGGCGKTTTAINLTSCLADLDKKALLVDLDPQGHATLGMGIDTEKMEASIYEVLLGDAPISKAVHPVKENLHTVFSDVVLSAFEQVMAGTSGREYRLAKELTDIENDYDYIVIDSPPSVGLLTFNGLMACDEVIIPVDPSYFSLQGLGKLLDTLRILEEKANHEITINIVATNIDQRTVFCKKVIEALREHFPDACLQTYIRTCTKIREATSRGKPIGEYDRRCIAYIDYRRLAEEIVFGEPKTLETEKPAPPRPKKSKLSKKSKKIITFRIAAPPHANVQIAGDFNSWKPEDLKYTEKRDQPLWHKKVSLRPGSYQYKFLVDGLWTPDPKNKNRVDDSLGGTNSLIRVEN